MTAVQFLAKYRKTYVLQYWELIRENLEALEYGSYAITVLNLALLL